MNKKAFSLIEILISVSIIIILAIVATTTNNNLKNNSNNSKVIADLNTIENAIVSYKTETSMLPNPGGNNNLFDIEGNYVSSIGSINLFGIYGKITEDTIEKRFLDVSPLDPRTNQYYSYGIAKNEKEFEIAGVIKTEDNYISKVSGDYKANNGIHSLIREYNGSNFISDKSSNLPYNPEERILIATDINGNIYKEGDIIENEGSDDLEIFFSDGSTSVISSGAVLTLSKMEFPKDNNLVSNIKLFLQAGSIWTKATKLSGESSFDINTSDLTASVRGTIFGIEKSTDDTKITVIEGKVVVEKEATNTYSGGNYFEPVNPVYIDTIEVLEGQNPKTLESSNPIITIQAPITLDDLGVEFTQPIIEIAQLSIEETITKEVNEKNEVKDCFLEDELVKNDQKGLSYLEKYVDYTSTCTPPIERLCQNGVLSGDNNYKYNSCTPKAPNQCDPYNLNGYESVSPVNMLASTTITKTENISFGGYIVGTLNTYGNVTCVDGVNYSPISAETKMPNCNTGFSPDGLSCKCNLGTDFYEGLCYENPFGVDYELVKVVPNVSGPYYWLITSNVGVDLGNSFGLVFDTNGVSQTATQINYLYDHIGPKNIIYSKFQKIKLSTNGEGNTNVIKYSSSIINTPQTLKVKFDGADWYDMDSIINDNTLVTGNPIILNSQNIKLTPNTSNIRIFKKTGGGGGGSSTSSSTSTSSSSTSTSTSSSGGSTSSSSSSTSSSSSSSGGPIVGNNYVGYGCGNCPAGSYKSGSSCFGHKYEKCSGIVGDNVCAEKSRCDWDNESWSGIYTG